MNPYHKGASRWQTKATAGNGAYTPITLWGDPVEATTVDHLSLQVQAMIQEKRRIGLKLRVERERRRLRADAIDVKHVEISADNL